MKPDKKKTVLVSGCAGFIGARTVEMLLDQGYTVVGIDNFNNYYDQRLKLYRLCRIYGQESRFVEKFHEIPSLNLNITDWIDKLLPESTRRTEFSFHLTDIENESEVDMLIDHIKPSAIINLAARAGVRASLENPQHYASTNVMGCMNLLEACHRHGVQKFVLASTSSLYAGQSLPFHEDLPVNTPISPYAATKKSAEMLCYTWHYLYNMNVTVLRYFTVYGPAGRPDMSVLRFVKWINEDSPITIYGDGKQSRDFTYIDDIAQGTISCLDTSGFSIINLGGGLKPVSINDLVKKVEYYSKKKAVTNYRKFDKSDVDHTQASNDLAKDLLNWRAKTNIDLGIKQTTKWYLNNKSWFKYIQV